MSTTPKILALTIHLITAAVALVLLILALTTLTDQINQIQTSEQMLKESQKTVLCKLLVDEYRHARNPHIRILGDAKLKACVYSELGLPG